ncbi:MAG: shikimate dehydrogenase [Thermoanaerobacterales bacterium]|jgi:shikimate dehydrogenase|nr:shikimate dehydrogenase [Thermoanaerobacterales bacterium]
MGIKGMTKVYGLFGDPVEHSLSPIMQNTAFQALGLDCVYLPFLVQSKDIGSAVQAVRALHLGGVNLTIPLKERVLPYLDEVEKEAEFIGAVNTIVNRNGRLCGYNTDAPGFLASLKAAGFNPSGKNTVILGAGGAARAVSFALAQGGAAGINILNRSVEKAEKLAQDLKAAYQVPTGVGDLSSDLAAALKGAELLVNATPVGMYPNHTSAPLLTRNQLHQRLLVCDLIYNPLQTRLLEEAEAANCRFLSGVGMLVWQGALAFQLWTGEKPPAALMEEAVLKALKR